MAQMTAYLIHSFPLYSSTFVNDEIDEMRRQGAKLALFSVQRPGKGEYPEAFGRFARETAYVFPIDPARMFRRHLEALLRKPAAYCGCLGWILVKPDLGIKKRLRSLFHFAEAVYLYPDLRARGCGHVHVHFLLGGASIALFLNRLYGLSYSLTAHGSDIFVDRVLQKEKLTYARFTRLATEYNAAFLRKLVPEKVRATLHVIPFGIDRGNIPPKGEAGPASARAPDAPVRILAVGRLIWQKAQHLLLEACAQAQSGGFRFHLRIIGAGPLQADLEARIRSLGLEKQVTLAGAMDSKAVWSEYRNADVFVLSSVSEGSPFVIMEAMACGLPVIAPALHGIPEMIRDGADGRLFRTGSAESLGEALMALLGDPGERERLGRAAEASAAERFDQRRAVAAFHDLLRPWMPATESLPALAGSLP